MTDQTISVRQLSNICEFPISYAPIAESNFEIDFKKKLTKTQSIVSSIHSWSSRLHFN